MIVGNYITNNFSPGTLKRVINNVVSELIPRLNEFDTIAFRGMSGALVAPAVAAQLDKDLILVRKEKTHSIHMIEGKITAQRYIIIDDFVDTGATIIEMVEKIRVWQLESPHTKYQAVGKCAMVVLYAEYKNNLFGLNRYYSISSKLPYEIPAITTRED